MKKTNFWIWALFGLMCLATVVCLVFMVRESRSGSSVDPSEDSSAFVVVAEAVPDVILEICYYSTYNFVGTRVDGYVQPTALLTRQAADSLLAVSREAKSLGYRLKIYDAYRPQRAVDHFVRWAASLPAACCSAA